MNIFHRERPTSRAKVFSVVMLALIVAFLAMMFVGLVHAQEVGTKVSQDDVITYQSAVIYNLDAKLSMMTKLSQGSAGFVELDAVEKSSRVLDSLLTSLRAKYKKELGCFPVYDGSWECK